MLTNHHERWLEYSVLSMNGMRSLSPVHTRSPMWVMLKIFIYNLLWLAEYQCKGVVKFNLSDLLIWGQFRRSWKRLNWKNLLLTLIAVTRIINLFRCISQFKYFEFPMYIFYFRAALFCKKQVIWGEEQLTSNFRWTLYKADISIKWTLLP